MADPERYQSALTGPEMDQALLDMANHTSERFAKGTANGVAVEAGTDGYNDNSLYYKNQAASQVQLAANQVSQATAQADRAANAADRAEAAVPVGTQSAVLFTTAQTLTATQQAQARKNIMAGGSNPNLLDNPWFTAGYLVNQRGQTSYAVNNNAYFIDRWRQSNINAVNTINITDDGLSIVKSGSNGRCILTQLSPVAYDTSKQYTFSIMDTDGNVASVTQTPGGSAYTTIRLNGHSCYARINGRSVELITDYSIGIRAMKLELGPYSTLANDAPPNYAEELAKCQRYFIRIKGQENTNYPIATGIASGTTTCRFILPTPAALRTNPSAPVVNGSWQVWGNGTYSNISAWGSQPMKAEHGIFFGVTSASNLTINQTYQLVNSTAGGYIDFSADL